MGRRGEGVKIVPVSLPVHAFWVNRVEAVIGQAKQRVLPCRQFASPEEQRGALDPLWLDSQRVHFPDQRV